MSGKYIPALMGQTRIYWDLENYGMVEQLFRNATEFGTESEIWKLNVAHVFFMQEKFKECIRDELWLALTSCWFVFHLYLLYLFEVRASE